MIWLVKFIPKISMKIRYYSHNYMQAGATQQVATLLSASTLSNAKYSSHVLARGTASPTSLIWHILETRKLLCYRGVTNLMIWHIGPLCHDNEVLNESTHYVFSHIYKNKYFVYVFINMLIFVMKSMWIEEGINSPLVLALHAQITIVQFVHRL